MLAVAVALLMEVALVGLVEPAVAVQAQAILELAPLDLLTPAVAAVDLVRLEQQ
jgi:hypothetical protein